jgi:hypothetical protein
MNAAKFATDRTRRIAAWMAALTLAGAAFAATGQEVTVALAGANEIPPVATQASGIGTIKVGADRSVVVRVAVSGMLPTVAHIHEAPAGANGPIIVPLVKGADNAWTAPAGTTLSDAQLAAFKAGNLYFNIHSEAYRSGEIRGQIKP